MSLNKFELKIGDKIKLKNMHRMSQCDPFITSWMKQFSNEIVTVEYIERRSNYFKIKEDRNKCWFRDNLIEYKLEDVKSKSIVPSTCTLQMADKSKKKVYLASPFFNDVELLDMIKILGCLRNKGLNVYSPYENQKKNFEFRSQLWRDATFKSDVEHISWADVVVAVVKGNYTDSGTVWEIGYAYAINKPIVVVNIKKEIVNLMIANSLHAYIESIEELEKYDFDLLPKKRYENYIW